MNIRTYAQILKDRNLLPANIQMATWNEWTLVSCFNVKNSEYISESVSMGIDTDKEIALFKALTEFCERSLAKSSLDMVAKLTIRSDGFAAFPANGISDLESKKNARENAFSEALERYLWSKWWDDVDVKFELKNLDFKSRATLLNEFNLQDIQTIQITPQGTDEYKLIILLAQSALGGYITGGAAGLVSQSESILNRAFGELLRHLIVLKRMSHLNVNSPGLSFYEKRLIGFGSGEWRDLVTNRLLTTGSSPIVLPDLAADSIVSHDHMDLISLHRCLFKDQPPFMGGAVERLCI